MTDATDPTDTHCRHPAEDTAWACWVAAPGRAEWREESLAPPAAGQARVRTLHSGVSRGTEGRVFRGEVPESEWTRMRAPFQAGDFPAPVKYGYISVGVVEAGPEPLLGRTVFCLHPHQTRYNVPAASLRAVPDGVPASRALLAAHLETAINALWDEPVRPGARVAVVGGGAIGLLVAWLAGRVPGAAVELVDVDPGRAALAAKLGVGFALPEDATPDADLVVHASGSSAGLARALGLAGFEATVLELSWYGDQPVAAPLGGAFHSRRLTLRSSQVGQVAAAQRARWTHARRLGLALSLLVDPALDALVGPPTPWRELPALLARLARPGPAAPCPRVDYDEPARG